MTLLNGHSTFSELYQLFSDGLHFVSKFYEIIERSALHTYYSSLLSAPTKCLMYHRYNNETVHNLFRISGGPEQWDALLASRGHGKRVPHVSFSPDNTTLASRSCTGLKLFDAAMGIPLSEIKADRVAIAADFSAIASSEDDITSLQDLKGLPVARLTSLRGYRVLALSSGGTRVAAGFLDGTVELWNIERGELVARLHGFEDHTSNDAENLAFSTSGTRLAYRLAGGIKLIDGTNGEFIADLDHQSRVRMFAFARDGSRIAALAHPIACQGHGQILTLWNTENGEIVGVTDLKEPEDELAISANGCFLVTGKCQEVTIWASSSSSNTLQLVAAMMIHDGGMMGAVISALPCVNPRTLAFSSDCSRLAVGSFGILHLWDIQIIKDLLGKYERAVTALDFSRDCLQLACGYECGTIELWATSQTLRLIASRQSYEVSVETVAFSPDGKQLVSKSFFVDVNLWDSRTLDPIETSQDLSFRDRRFNAMALSNRLLATAADGQISLWNPEFVSTIEHSNSKILSFSNNGRLLASFREWGDDITGTIFDIVQLETITTLKFSNRCVHRMTFHQDDFQLVMHFDNGDIQSFDVPTNMYCEFVEYYCIMKSSSQYEEQVPVLWIPKSLGVVNGVKRSSVIAF